MFSYNKLHIFDKSGAELPLNYNSNIKVVIPNKYGSDARFFGITDVSCNIAGFHKISSGGRFDASEYKPTHIFTPGGMIDGNTKTTVKKQVSTEQNSYYIDDIDYEHSEWHLDPSTLTFPSLTFDTKISFDKVSTELVETQSLYILVETKDSSGNTIYDTPYNAMASDPEMEEWCSRFRLLFFIDCRNQKDFRTFTVSNDEVIWSDRIFADLSTETGFRVDLGFSGENEGVYEQSMYVCIVDTATANTLFDGDPGYVYPIGEISMSAETEGEDERYRALFADFGIPDPKNYEDVFNDANSEDDKPDYRSVNKHSKKIFLAYDQIFPYAGTYKALINAVNILGYDDIFFREWYKERGIDEKYGGGYVAYDVTYGSDSLQNTINNISLTERIQLKKLNWLSMMYHLNKELTEEGIDKFGFPGVENTYNYYNTGNLVKLISLRKWLEKYIVGLNCRIIDVGGEGVYFERYRNNTYGIYQTVLEYGNSKNVAPVIYKDNNLISDASSYITVEMKHDAAKTTFEDMRHITFSQMCGGYIDSSGVYHTANADIKDSSIHTNSSFIYADTLLVGNTLDNNNDFQSYSLKTVSSLDSFIFGDSFIDASSPRIHVIDNRIEYVAQDLVTKNKNTAFRNTPIIQLERAVLKRMTNEYEQETLYKIYPVKNGDATSYIIEDTKTGDKTGSDDYVTLIPPTYTEDASTVTITPRNSVPFVVNKTQSYPHTFDVSTASPGETVITEKENIYRNTTTYGLRYSADNVYTNSQFCISGYVLENDLENLMTPDVKVYQATNPGLDVSNGIAKWNIENPGKSVLVMVQVYDTSDNELVDTLLTISESVVCVTFNSATRIEENKFRTNIFYRETRKEYPSTEYILEIYDGKMLFDDTPNNRKVYLNFTYDSSTKDVNIRANVAHSDGPFFPITYLPDSSAAFHNFVPGKEYGKFADSYIKDSEKSIKYNDIQDIIVGNAGEYTVTALCTDSTNTIYAAEANRKANVLTQSPKIKTTTNFPTSMNDYEELGTESDIEKLKNEYLDYCIYSHRCRIPLNGTDSSEMSFEYLRHIYNLNAPDEHSVAHLVNTSSMFSVSGIRKISDENGVRKFLLTLYRHTRKDNTRFVESYDESAVKHVYEGEKTQADNILAGTESKYTPFDVELVFFNNIGNYPVFQIPARMMCPKATGLYNYKYNQEYHVYFTDSSAYWDGRSYAEEITKCIKDPNITLYIVPEWETRIKIVGVENNTIYAQNADDYLNNAFKKNDTVKIRYESIDDSDYYAYASYKFIGYDSLGTTMMLRGKINKAYVVNDLTSYVWAKLDTSTAGGDKKYSVKNGLLAWKTDGMSEPSTEFTYIDEEGRKCEYTIEAMIKDASAPNIVMYRVCCFYYDENDGKLKKFNPWIDKTPSEKANTYISYAHGAYVDYSMNVLNEVPLGDGIIRKAIVEDSIQNKAILDYSDKMFDVIYREFDINNGIKMWMSNTYGNPSISDSSAYEYDCPASVTENDSDAVFKIDFTKIPVDESVATVLWKVRKRIDCDNTELMFESHNKALYLSTEESGIYDIDLEVYDENGSVFKNTFIGAYTVD